MVEITHRVGIAAPQATVYEQLATAEGLAEWWTRDVIGESQKGSRLDFFFGGPERSVGMEVVGLTPDEHVEWRCVDGPAEWIDTHLVFDLKSVDDETVILFTHTGWREPVEFMHHCSTKWGQFLLGMKSGLEGGKATPYPDDVKISSWG